MHTPSIQVERRPNLIAPKGYEISWIGEVLPAQPDPGCGIILGQIVPVRRMKISNRAANDKLSGREKKENVEYDSLLLIRSQRVTLTVSSKDHSTSATSPNDGHHEEFHSPS